MNVSVPSLVMLSVVKLSVIMPIVVALFTLSPNHFLQPFSSKGPKGLTLPASS